MRKKTFGLNEPLRHPDHHRPRTRRELIAQGFQLGMASVVGTSILGFGAPARAALSSSLDQAIADCGIQFDGAGKIPFICFDLAGGANIAGSNVLVGGRGGQLDFLDTSGYVKQGLPADMVPNALNPGSATNDYVNTELGLAFHADSGFLRGIQQQTSAATRAAINGCVIAARSENDTGNNPHNPMYGINMAGARGSLLALCGSSASESGGNSLAPPMLVNNAVRPSKIDRPGDVTGLVDVGENRVQELEQKALEVDDPRAVWHLIGHLQRNKVRQVAPAIHLWQSVDRLSLAAEIARRAPGASILVQVNSSGAEQQGGVRPEQVAAVVEGCADLGLEVRGLMTIGANSTDEQVVRSSYTDLANLRTNLWTTPEALELEAVALTQQGQRITRGAAVRVVVEGDLAHDDSMLRVKSKHSRGVGPVKAG